MQVKTVGRIFITFNLRAVTGLHIGGHTRGIEIGGVDNPVIRDPVTDRPFLPGSSLKGKMRSLLEKQQGKPLNREIGDSRIHICGQEEDYRHCSVCHVFGVPGELKFSTPTRLLVRDIQLDPKSAQELEKLPLDRPFTEVKTEVAIDRVTSAANPRPLERVPAGAVFGPGEVVYAVYDSDDGRCQPDQDVTNLRVVFEGMQLLEHDYLGGSGSRGSGKVVFEKLALELRRRDDYFTPSEPMGEFRTLSDLMASLDEILTKIRRALGIQEAGRAGGLP